eukprot:158589-Prorocentrum_minimum.AAC.1
MRASSASTGSLATTLPWAFRICSSTSNIASRLSAESQSESPPPHESAAIRFAAATLGPLKDPGGWAAWLPPDRQEKARAQERKRKKKKGLALIVQADHGGVHADVLPVAATLKGQPLEQVRPNHLRPNRRVACHTTGMLQYSLFPHSIGSYNGNNPSFLAQLGHITGIFPLPSLDWVLQR